jgi:hypothetical protein
MRWAAVQAGAIQCSGTALLTLHEGQCQGRLHTSPMGRMRASRLRVGSFERSCGLAVAKFDFAKFSSVLLVLVFRGQGADGQMESCSPILKGSPRIWPRTTQNLVIRSELSCLISSLVHPPHKHAHSTSASAYPIKCMSDRGPFALVHCVICTYGYGFGVILFRSSCNQLDRDFER